MFGHGQSLSMREGMGALSGFYAAYRGDHPGVLKPAHMETALEFDAANAENMNIWQNAGAVAQKTPPVQKKKPLLSANLGMDFKPSGF